MNIKRRKIFFIALVFIVSLFLKNIVYAAGSLAGIKGDGRSAIGRTIIMSPSGNMTYGNNGNTDAEAYCIQYNRTLKGTENPKYTVYAYLEIRGKTGTMYTSTTGKGKTVTDDDNAILAYILGAAPEKYRAHYNGKASDSNITYVQKALWYYIHDRDNPWKKYGLQSTKKSWQTDWGRGFDYKGSNDYYNNAKSYPNKISNQGTVSATDNTDKDNLKSFSYTDASGTPYLAVGAFNWNFNGNLTSVTVNNSKITGLKFGYYDGADMKVKNTESEISSIISNGKDFYLLIPKSSSITNVNNVSAVISPKSTASVYGANIWFLGINRTSDWGYWQKIIIVESIKNTTKGTTLTVEDIKFDSNLKITKVDKNNQTKKLSNVQFVVRCTSCSEDSSLVGKWLMLNNGTITYSQNSNIDSFIKLSTESQRENKISTIDSKYKFTTNSSGYVTINKIKPGTYEVIEILNPNSGYTKYPIQKVSTNITSGDSKSITIMNSPTTPTDPDPSTPTPDPTPKPESRKANN